MTALGRRARWRRPAPRLRGATPNAFPRRQLRRGARRRAGEHAGCAPGAALVDALPRPHPARAAMGFTVLAEVAERARSSSTVGGGSFRAERVTPHGVNESLVDELYVVVKVAKLGQRPEESSATLRADAARWREVGAPQQQTLTPCARPTATAATRPAERRRVGTRRERLPADRVAEEGAELVRRCAGG